MKQLQLKMNSMTDSWNFERLYGNKREHSLPTHDDDDDNDDDTNNIEN